MAFLLRLWDRFFLDNFDWVCLYSVCCKCFSFGQSSFSLFQVQIEGEKDMFSFFCTFACSFEWRNSSKKETKCQHILKT